MATINLGAIKFSWKGAYNNSTQYQVDDVVSSGGSSYVCILASQGNAVSNGTYWNVMSQAGTNGTDLTSTLTTQGDIVYRDGSGLQRLAAGTNGQLLKTGGSGANPSWTDAPSGVVKKIEEFTNSTRQSLSASASKINIFSGTFTTTTANSKVWIQAFVPSWGTEAGSINMGFSWNGTNYDGRVTYNYGSSNDTYLTLGQAIFDNSGTPGSHAWEIYYDSNAGSSRPHSIVNPTNADDSRIVQDVTSIIFTEFKN
tara:strand:- start:310 stop:1074 length:765 start_codon:yes stop_codon:yes gene_type:complete